MFLEYGVSQQGELVYIGQVARGATRLTCPYCGSALIAKKGPIKVPHFAHSGETCRQVLRDPEAIALPAYDNFNLRLPPKALKVLQAFHDEHQGSHYDLEYLQSLELLTYKAWAGRREKWELSKRGKIPFGELSLMLFNEFQEPLIAERAAHLENVAEEAYTKRGLETELAALEQKYQALQALKRQLSEEGVSIFHNPHYEEAERAWEPDDRRYWELRAEIQALTRMDYDTAISDVRLYRAQWRRILVCSLYFLEIGGGQYYKIGVTTRDIESRITEIKGDLLPHLGNVTVKALGVWPHRGNVEQYFKHRYAAHRQDIGTLTEYYQFDDVSPVLRDLRRMKMKELGEIERRVLAGDGPEFERARRFERMEEKRRAMIRVGMQRAKKRGKHVGRPKGSGESDQEFLEKPESVRIQELLAQGLSQGRTAKEAGVAINTVKKVRNTLEALQEKVIVERSAPGTISAPPDEDVIQQGATPKPRRPRRQQKLPEFPPLTRENLPCRGKPMTEKVRGEIFAFCEAEYQRRHGHDWRFKGGTISRSENRGYRLHYVPGSSLAIGAWISFKTRTGLEWALIDWINTGNDVLLTLK